MKKIQFDSKNLEVENIKTKDIYIYKHIDSSGNNNFLIKSNLNIDKDEFGINIDDKYCEELDVYKDKEGNLYLFRPFDVLKRLNKKSDKVSIPKDIFINVIKEIIEVSRKGINNYDKLKKLKLKVCLQENIVYINLAENKLKTMQYSSVSIYNCSNEIKSSDFLKSDNLVCVDSNKNIREIKGTGIFGISESDMLITSKSQDVLPSIIKDSILYIAKNYLDIRVEQRNINVDELRNFSELGVCSRHCTLNHVESLIYNDKEYKIKQCKIRPVTNEIFDILRGIQQGYIQGPRDWIVKI